MPTTRLVASLSAILLVTPGLIPARADEHNQILRTDSRGARPAVLVVPAWGPNGRSRAADRLEVVEPGGVHRPPTRAYPWFVTDKRGANGAPLVGPDYELVQTVTPNPMIPQLTYYVYLNVSDPGAVRNYRELQRAQRAEARAAAAEQWNERDMARRQQRLLRGHDEATEDGLMALRDGDYRRAVVALTLAAEMDEGDPACRIHLAQARVGLGHDAEAAKALHRALELQPKLVPMDLHLAQYYPRERVFTEQVDALAERVTRNANASAEEYFLLGFMEFQRGRTDRAHAAFERAARGLPRDDELQVFLALTKPAKVEGAARRSGGR